MTAGLVLPLLSGAEPVKSKDNATEGRSFPQMIMLPTVSLLLSERFWFLARWQVTLGVRKWELGQRWADRWSVRGATSYHPTPRVSILAVQRILRHVNERSAKEPRS